MSITLPPDFLVYAVRGADWSRWLASLPRLIEQVLGEWELDWDGSLLTGETAVALPVVTEPGELAVLKVGFPHPEADHEHLALRAWGGQGAVRLLRADPRRSLLLLERADAGRDLSTLPILDACEVTGQVYARLHRSPLPQLRQLSALAGQWAEELIELRALQVVPRRLIEAAVGLARDFAADPNTDRALIHTDLHYGNILAAEREPWLVIDPKPLTGDPAYEVAPLLWNRWDEALASSNARAAVLERLYTVVDVAELDEDRVRDWVVVRCLVNVLWSSGTDGEAANSDLVTRSMTIAKAVQR